MVSELLSALHRSHDRLVAALTPLTGDEVTAGSYCTDWTIAQVASHLGSGSEIFGHYIEAGLQQAPAPGAERSQSVWDRWNAKSPQDQARDALPAGAALLDRLDALTDEECERWRLDLFGSERTIQDIVRMRLAEHAVHTWAIVVALEPDATVADDAAALLVDTLPWMAGLIGKPAAEPVRVHLTTSNPAREFLLEVGAEGVQLTAVDAAPAPAGTTASALRLPAEALVRLVYGRLDAEHTPAAVDPDGTDLNRLRSTFPGV
jgi:uncharacterized protein (TIGR03083 family)